MKLILHILKQINKNINNFIIYNLNMVEKECELNLLHINIEHNEVLFHMMTANIMLLQMNDYHIFKNIKHLFIGFQDLFFHYLEL